MPIFSKVSKRGNTMKNVRDYFKNDKLADHLGLEIVEVTPGTSVIRMPVQTCHMNSLGIVHGGAIFSLADFAFAVASNSHGTVAVAINANISFLKAARGGVLTATAREASRNPKIATYNIEVTDGENQLIATFHGMVYRKPDPIANFTPSE
jgi:acyl-CoA thioesterase